MLTMVNVNPGLYNQPLGFEYLGQNSLFFATSLFRQRFINPERTLVENKRNQRSTYWYLGSECGDSSHNKKSKRFRKYHQNTSLRQETWRIWPDCMNRWKYGEKTWLSLAITWKTESRMQAARRSLNIGEVGATAIDHQDLPVAGIPWLGKDSQQEMWLLTIKHMGKPSGGW
jgi:hypothetical protein